MREMHIKFLNRIADLVMEEAVVNESARVELIYAVMAAHKYLVEEFLIEVNGTSENGSKILQGK